MKVLNSEATGVYAINSIRLAVYDVVGHLCTAMGIS